MEEKSNKEHFKITLNMVEIYNENIRDLLSSVSLEDENINISGNIDIRL